MSTPYCPRPHRTRPVRAFQARLAATEQTLRFCRRELATLQRLTALVLPTQPLHEALHAAAQELGAATGVPIVVIERYDDAHQELECVAATGVALPGDLVGGRFPAAQCLAGRVARSGQVYIATHTYDQPPEVLDALGRLGAQAVACLPLTVAERVVGTVTLAHPDAGVLATDRIALAQRLVTPIAALVTRGHADVRSPVDEQPLRTILDQLATGVFQIDAEGRYHYVNRRIVEPIGLTPDKVIGRSILEILPPADAQAELERYRRIIATGRTTEYEVTFETPQGPWTYVMVGQVLNDSQGIGRTLLVSGVDITAYKQAEAALQVALTKYRTLFDSFPLGISVCDAKGQIVGANRMADSLLDLGADEHLQRTIDDAAWQIVRPDGSPMPSAEYAAVRALHEQRLVANVEMGVITPRSTTTWLTVTATPLPLDAGGVVITYDDITARRLAEVTLRLSEAHYRGLMESLGSMVFTLDATGTLQYVNQMAAQQLGGTPQDLVGQRIDSLLPAAVVSAHIDALRQVFTDGTVVVHEDHVPVQGRLRWYRISFHPIYDDLGQVLVALVNATDIHDLKTTQEELRTLNQTLEARVAQRTAEVQDLYDHAPTGYYALDGDGQIINVNQTMLDWLGYTRTEVLGRPFIDLIPPADRATFLADFPVFKKHGWLRDYDGALLRKDGSTFWVLHNATAVYDANGVYTSSRATVFDNTERRKAEDALRESEARYRTLVEQMTQGVIVYQDDHVVFGNAAAAQIIGCSLEDLHRTSLIDLAGHLHADDQRRVMPSPSDWPGAGTITTEPFRFTRIADSALRWVFATSIITTSHGLPARLVVFTDVTALKLAEEQLRLSEARMHLLLDKTPAVIFSSLAEPDFHSTFVSESVRQVLGYAPAQFLSSPGFWASRIHPDDKARVFGDAPEFLAQGWCQYEYRCRHADGSYRWIESGASLLPAVEGHPAEVVGYMIDITVRKQAKVLLQQANAELSRAARAKDEFLANMSHELRSPLNAILGFSEILQAGIYEPLTAGQQGAVQHIETSGRHLLALINDILDLSKGEADKLTLNIERIDIVTICQASLMFVEELALKKEVYIAVEYASPEAEIEADPRRLKQMLVNLLSNAVKFTPSGGHIVLEVAVNATTEQVRFSVKDTGIGIAPEDLGRLFQPFSQIESTLSRQQAGSGLGLALVRRLATLHGGEVGVTSAVGTGSCFTITLPVHQPTLVAPAPKVPGEPADTSNIVGSAGVRVLVTDDNKENLELIAAYLQAQGYAVVATRNGQEALAQVGVAHPMVIVMDIQMPDLDGLEVIRRLRAQADWATTPIIALTALAMPGDRERCLAAGATAYLTKPVRLQELIATIQRLLSA
ncbi:MAG: PAS domain S-box protein [Chloroflexales bacterium]|jgi:PAS domain S-box-containing protein